MCLQALHMVTEPIEGELHSENKINIQEFETISFFKNFFLVKALINLAVIIVYSDYLMHPSVQIRLHLWKKFRSWVKLDMIELENFKECRNLIKVWNNHFENMNALVINVISDLISSILFLVCFYISSDSHFEGVYFLISIVNLFILAFLLAPVLSSVIRILMQGKSDIYGGFYNKLKQEVSYFDGCLGIKDLKFWMTAQNSIKCKFCFFICV